MGQGILHITDVEGDSVEAINMQSFTPTVPTENDTVRIITLPTGWSMIHINAPVDSLVGHNLELGIDIPLADQEMDTFLLATLHCQQNPGGPYTKVTSYTSLQDVVLIAKDNNGAAYLPEFNFNGIGNLTDFQGYQIRTTKPTKIAFKGDNHIIESGEYENFIGGTVSLQTGWNTIGFPLFAGAQKPIVQILAPIVDKVIIAKQNDGMAYMPSFNFDGIGLVSEDEGYQIKVTEACSFTVQFQLYSGLINFNNITPQNEVEEILEEEDDTTPPPVITDTNATVTIQYDAIKQLTTLDNFGANHVEPTKCSAAILAIKEFILIKYKFIEEPFNVFGLENFMDLIFSGRLLDFLENQENEKEKKKNEEQIKNIEEIEKIKFDIEELLKRDDLRFEQKEILDFALKIREDDITQQFSPKFKNSFLKDLEQVIKELADDKPQEPITEMYPFYTAQNVKQLVQTFKIKAIPNDQAFNDFLFILGGSNVKIFFEFFTIASPPARYGLSSPLSFAKFQDLNTKIYGDDPLTAATDGFTAGQQFSVGLQIIDQSNFYSQKILYNVEAVFNPANTNTFQSLATRVISQITNIQ